MRLSCFGCEVKNGPINFKYLVTKTSCFQIFWIGFKPFSNLFFLYKRDRKRADLFSVCFRSGETSVSDLQIVYRSSTDYLQIICRLSAEYLQNVCRMSGELICNLCRHSADKAEGGINSKQNKILLHQSNTFYFYCKYIKYSLNLRQKSLG